MSVKKWISVRERLPDEWEGVAINISIGKRWSKCSYDSDEQIWRDDYGCTDRYIKPTHWLEEPLEPEWPTTLD